MRARLLLLAVTGLFVAVASANADPGTELLDRRQQGLSMRDFRALISTRIGEAASVAKVEYYAEDGLKVSVAGGGSITVGLMNPLIRINQEPEQRDAIIDELVAIVTSAISRPTLTAKTMTREAFVASLKPIIKPELYLEELTNSTSDMDGAEPYIAEELTPGLFIMVGLDFQDRLSLLQSGAGAPHGLSDAQLQAKALENLENQVRALKIVEHSGLQALDYDPNYNSSLLLLREIASSADRQAYTVSDRLLQRTKNGWVVFE